MLPMYALKQSLRRIPYWAYLLVCLAIFVITVYLYYRGQMTRSGSTVKFEHGYYILDYVKPGDPVYNAGIRTGDTLVSMNSIPIEKWEVGSVNPRPGDTLISGLKPSLSFTQFMMCTVYEDNENVFDSLCAGATGYLLKNSPPSKITDAIIDLFHGGSPMSSVIARKVIQAFRPAAQQPKEIESLTNREREILDLLAKGYRYKEIAEQLSISFETVRTHIHNIYDKLHVQSRTEALNKAFPR